MDKLDQIESILGELTGYAESCLDDNRAWYVAKSVLEYVDRMWAVFGVDSKKNREEALKGEINETD